MKKHEQWSSKIGFILAAAGSAIGLGAIWKFPYMAGTNGGGLFFLLFILFTILIGAPILLAEFVIGRSTQSNAVTAFQKLSKIKAWRFTGYLGIIVSFIILSFYSVVGGWILSYLFRTLSGGLTADGGYAALFDSIIANPYEVIGMQLLFMVITVVIVRGGVQKGIERASKYMMPALFAFFILLAIRSLTLPGAMEGIKFLLAPDLDDLTAKTVLLAMGQSFFALSIGISIMITYASYLPKSENMPKSAGIISILNIVISLLAGLVIFPAVFALGFQPDAGPGLIFVVLPAVFNNIAFGSVFFAIFLVLLLFATLTSAFSLLENMVAVVTANKGNRQKSTISTGILVFLAGIPSALSFGVLANTKLFGKSIFDFADYITSNFGMPIGALFISFFAGYIMQKDLVKDEFMKGSNFKKRVFICWYFLIRYIVPIAIIIILLQSLEIL